MSRPKVLRGRLAVSHTFQLTHGSRLTAELVCVLSVACLFQFVETQWAGTPPTCVLPP